ncbi:MAG: HAD-IIIA family hydrolase [Candidatus Riflebacteria bacterium]|nr:HAD-IIIA family hydrolase [Candidatus Riflebacteria bacterium]
MSGLHGFGVFLDRDGTVVVNDGYLADPAALSVYPDVPEALALLLEAGARLFLVTNQSGVARGFFDERQLQEFHAALQERLGRPFAAIYYCPHHPTEGEPPYRRACRCRKPDTGLVELGLADWSLDARDCYFIGDSDLDVTCGRKAHTTTIQILGHGRRQVSPHAVPDHACQDLLSAARWVVEDVARKGREASSRQRSLVPMRELVAQLLGESARVKQAMIEANAQAVADAAALIVESLRAGGKVLFCGNGGSAADAQHLAAELSGRYLKDRPGLAGVALTTNSSALTAIGNDFGFQEVFARQLDGFCKPGDVVLGISTSGNSANVVRALERARQLGARTIAFTGSDRGQVDSLADVLVKVPSRSTPRIQEGHITAGHIVCHLVEEALTTPVTPP